MYPWEGCIFHTKVFTYIHGIKGSVLCYFKLFQEEFIFNAVDADIFALTPSKEALPIRAVAYAGECPADMKTSKEYKNLWNADVTDKITYNKNNSFLDMKTNASSWKYPKVFVCTMNKTLKILNT